MKVENLEISQDCGLAAECGGVCRSWASDSGEVKATDTDGWDCLLKKAKALHGKKISQTTHYKPIICNDC